MHEDHSLTRFFQLTGKRALLIRNHLWYEVGPRVFFPFPFHEPFTLSTEDLETLWYGGALILRYLTDAESRGCPSYISVLSDKEYGLSHLESKSRNQTRRGLENCSVRQISFDYLLREGTPLVMDTMSRQGRRFTDRACTYWQNFFSHGDACTALEAWGAFVGNALAAYLVAITHGECAHIHMVFSRTDLLKYYPINALSFVFAQHAIRRPDISLVSYGLRSIRGEAEGLKKFKQSMGFREVAVTERIEVSPRLKVLFDWGLARVMSAVFSKFGQGSEFAGNIQGLTSMYLKQESSE